MVEKEKVLRAIEKILKEGKVPTARRVVEKMGGSHRDVGPILKEWKQKKANTVPPHVSRLRDEYRALDPIDKKLFQRLTSLRRMTVSEMLRRLGNLDKKQGGRIRKALKGSDRAEVIPLPKRKK